MSEDIFLTFVDAGDDEMVIEAIGSETNKSYDQFHGSFMSEIDKTYLHSDGCNYYYKSAEVID